MGYGNFRGDHETFHDTLIDLKVPHTYKDGPKREHTWASGWLPGAVGWLVQGQWAPTPDPTP
jgi:hypothetical protein